MDVLNCSRLVVVSSTDAACVLVPCDSACAAAATCPDAPDSEPTAPLTSPSTPPKRCTISRIPAIICAVSSRPLTWMEAVRSPEASLPVSPTASVNGWVMLRANHHANSTASSGPTMPPPSNIRRMESTCASVTSVFFLFSSISSWMTVIAMPCMNSRLCLPLPLFT